MQYVISLANVTMVAVLLMSGVDACWCVYISLTNTTVPESSPLRATSSPAVVYIMLQMMEM